MSKACLLATLSLVLTAGCGEQPAPAGPASGPSSPPAHPAMLEPPSAQASATREPRPGLPPGHPPVAAPTVPGKQPAAGPARSLAERLSELGLTVRVPAGWMEEASSSPMRLGTLRLPRVEGDAEDGELSVIPAFGTVEANVQRWVGQFEEKPAPVTQSRDVGGLAVTVVEMEGTFSAGSGPMMAKATPPKPGTKLLGAILRVPAGEGLLFFKAWGPRATMERWKPSFDELVSSIQKVR